MPRPLPKLIALSLKIIRYAIGAAVAAWVVSSLLARFNAERNDKNVELAVAWSDASAVASANNYSRSDFFDRLKAAGVTTVVVEEETPATLEDSGEAFFISRKDYNKFRLFDIITDGSYVKPDTVIFSDAKAAAAFEAILKIRYRLGVSSARIGARRFVFVRSDTPVDDLPVGFSRRKAAFLENYGFRAALMVSSAGDAAWLLAEPPANLSCLISEPAERFGGGEMISRLSSRFTYLDFEFYPAAARLSFPAAAVTRAHRITAAEKAALSPRAETARLLRASRERGIRFLWMTLDDKRSVDENLDKIKTLSRRLKKSGYALAAASSPVRPVSGRGVGPMPFSFLRKALAFAAALFMPPALAAFARRRLSALQPLAAFALFNVAAVTGALVVAALISSPEFVMKLDEIGGVKFLMAVSYVAALAAVFDPAETKTFFLSGMKIYQFVFLSAIFCAAAFALWRSGNDGFASGMELELRAFLEKLFGVRPRWKEVLVGQPFVYLAFRYKSRKFLAVGMAAAVSVTNTFLHAHTPLVVSLSRTLLGAVAGLGAAVLVSGVADIVKLKLSRRSLGAAHQHK